MIKLNLPLKFAALTLATLSTITSLNPVKAGTFDETAVEQSQFIAIAQPFGDQKYNLIVIEQIPNKQACWSETGSNPVTADILLLNFDFSGHCRRSTDANGYSIRVNGEDLGLQYLLSVVETNGELQLIGTNRVDPRQPQVVVGTSQGLAGAPMKIQLNPGWRFSKRTYQGKVLGHVYFSYTDEQAAIDNPNFNAPNMEDNNFDTNPNDMIEDTNENMQEFTAPEIIPNNKIQNNDQSVNIDYHSSINDVENENENLIPCETTNNNDSSLMTSNIPLIEEKTTSSRKKYGLTMTRFDRMRNR